MKFSGFIRALKDKWWGQGQMAIIQAITQLAQAPGLKTTAEGVEGRTQRDF